jgi:hypothetical protein
MLFRFSKHWSILLTFKKINDWKTLPAISVPGVRRAKAARFPVGASPTRRSLQPEALESRASGHSCEPRKRHVSTFTTKDGTEIY